jgi:hypothetical protein
MLINGKFTGTDLSNDTSPDTASFTQCWPSDVVVGTLDTRNYPNGPLAIEYAARNAAGVISLPNETLQVDNTPVTLSLSTANDPDPNVWVNHAVDVAARATAGPSGIGGTVCRTNSGAGYIYPTGGITLNGTGIWRVSCTSWDNAFDVNDQPATSPTENTTVHIDQTPPTIFFESANPGDPQAVVVAASDGQSGVAGGQIEMRPASGGSWDSLATQFDGTHLLARFDDAALNPGTWVVQASSCDKAGNCGTTSQTLSLPVRDASVSSVGFVTAKDPLRGSRGCSARRVRRHRHKRHACQTSHLVFTSRERSLFGKPVQLRGRLTDVRGVPIANAPIHILTAPDNGPSPYSQAASATTGGDGIWRVSLPPGPSRLIAAVYGGSHTIQPSQGWARLIVPALVKVLRVWPRHIAWGGKVHIKAQLVGGYLPTEGALVRLRLGYGSAKVTYGVREHVGGSGIFEVTNTFGPGPASLVLHYWLQECTLPEGDYPYAPACGPRTGVTLGGRPG